MTNISNDSAARFATNEEQALGPFVKEYGKAAGTDWSIILVGIFSFLFMTFGAGISIYLGIRYFSVAWWLGLVGLSLFGYFPSAFKDAVREIRDARRRIRLHEGGLAIIDGHRATAIPWKAVQESYGETQAATLLGFTMSQTKLLLMLMTKDDFMVNLSADIIDYETLNPIVSEAVTTVCRSRYQALLTKQHELPFGPLFVTREGIRVEGQSFTKRLWNQVSGSSKRRVLKTRTVNWKDISKIQITRQTSGKTTYNQLEFTHQGEWWPIYACPVGEVPNFLILVEVLEQLGHPIQS